MYIYSASGRKLNSGANLLVVDCDGTITKETHWLLEDCLSQTQELIPRFLHKAITWIAGARKPNIATIGYLKSKANDPNCQILVLTSRLCYLVPATSNWLSQNEVPFDTIVCRDYNEEPLKFKLDFIRENQLKITTIVDNDRRVLRGARQLIRGTVELLHPSDLRYVS